MRILSLTGNAGEWSSVPKLPLQRYRFTVITPTYNRAHLIERTFKSLYAQTFKDFEWVVIDDGSTDGTEELVSSWKASFPIRYLWKFNGGLHTALNLGTAVAEGEFVTQLDSDDYYVPHALERFDCLWTQIPTPERFSSLIGLCCREDGSVIGSPLPRQRIDTFTLRDALALLDGDRCSIVRTDVARAFPYPEFKNERFMIPSLVHNRIMSKYAARHFNEPLKVVCPAPGHMSSQDLRWASPKGAFLYHTELALSDVPKEMRAKSALNAMRFAAVAALRPLFNH
jgi:glycosyltransferase involved in cell wall biosynthesis